MELGSKYGKIDIMWFDAGWVCEKNKQDIRLGEVIDKIRKFQTGMLCADRTVGGPYENYVTPEQCVPDVPLGIPWESCITLGNSFAYSYDDHYKGVREIVTLLIDIVSKGGNLALNIAPQPDGRLPKSGVDTLKGLGAWLKNNGEAIYGTRVCHPYKKDEIAFTKKGEIVYAIELFEDDATEVKTEVWIPYDGAVSSVTTLMGNDSIEFEKKDHGYMLQVPKLNTEAAPIARVFCLK